MCDCITFVPQIVSADMLPSAGMVIRSFITVSMLNGGIAPAKADGRYGEYDRDNGYYPKLYSG